MGIYNVQDSVNEGLNQDGLAVNIRVENTQTGIAWVNYANEYEDQRPTDVTTYQWTDGNINHFKGQNDINFVYSWGSDGKISAFMETMGGNDLVGLLLQYECN